MKPSKPSTQPLSTLFKNDLAATIREAFVRIVGDVGVMTNGIVNYFGMEGLGGSTKGISENSALFWRFISLVTKRTGQRGC